MSFQSEMVEKVEFLGISLGFYHASHMQGNRWRMGGWEDGCVYIFGSLDRHIHAVDQLVLLI